MKRTGNPIAAKYASGTLAESDLNPRLELLRPLLRSLPRTTGEVLVHGVGAFCIDCGGRDSNIMIRKHRRNCPHMAWFKALETLGEMLGAETKGRKK